MISIYFLVGLVPLCLSKLTTADDPTSDQCHCGISKTGPVTGRPSDPAAYPWLAALHDFRIYDNDKVEDSFCSGWAINPTWLVTAAHCVSTEGKEKPKKRVTLADIKDKNITGFQFKKLFDESGQLRPLADGILEVDKWIVHEKYGQKAGEPFHDIALLHLKNPTKATPICLPQKGAKIVKCKKSQRMTIAGWGRTSTNGPRSNILLEIDVCEVHKTCEFFYGFNFNNSLQICGHGLHGSTCRGDSGGVLMEKNNGIYQAAGIVSFSCKKCTNMCPDVYTRVASYIDWIHDTIELYDTEQNTKTRWCY